MYLHLVTLCIQDELCIAFGPGVDMVDSTRIIGENQYYFARVCSTTNRTCVHTIHYQHIDTARKCIQLSVRTSGFQAHLRRHD